MDLLATRELARIQSVLHVLKNQRDNLSELSDISAFRGLEESCREDLQEAQKRGLVPQDPVSLVRADWCRLSTWSNRIQMALRAADDLGSLVETAGSKADQESGKKKKKSDTGWVPTLVELQRLRTALEAAPRVMEEAMELGRVDLLASDWSNGRPYPELVEVADAMEWAEKLELAESPGAWAHGIGLRERPLVASRLAVERSSSSIERRLRSLKDRLARVVGLIQLHGQHAGTLEEVGRLTETGQVETARRLIGTLQAAFGDLDYSAREQRLAQLEKQLKSQSEKVAEAKDSLQVLGREAGQFFAFPPIGLLSRVSAAQQAVEKVAVETAQLGKVGGDSEVDKKVSRWITELRNELDSLQTVSMSRLRRWIRGTTVFWFLLLVAGGVTFLQVRVGQERERQRVVAEVKAKAEAMRARMASGETFQAEAGDRLVLGVAVRWIPAGRFQMGSPSSEQNRASDEVQHEVVLTRGFFLAETECTQAQWEEVMGSNPSNFKGTNRPVEVVSWNDAVEYCSKLTKKQRNEGLLADGWEWRLPTESEWEYAARAGTTGARHADLDVIAWWSDNSGGETHSVGQKAANEWGLHDMMGNVWEWCSDWYGEYPTWYGESPTGSVTDPMGSNSTTGRVNRGGGWNNSTWQARSSSRGRDVPGFRSMHLGFRPALSSVR